MASPFSTATDHVDIASFTTGNGAAADVLDFSAFAIDGNATSTAPATISLLTANPGVATDVAGKVVLLTNVAGPANDVTTAAGLQTALDTGDYANLNMAANSKAIFVTQLANVPLPFNDSVFYATSDNTGAITVTLVGQVDNVNVANFVAGNFHV